VIKTELVCQKRRHYQKMKKLSWSNIAVRGKNHIVAAVAERLRIASTKNIVTSFSETFSIMSRGREHK